MGLRKRFFKNESFKKKAASLDEEHKKAFGHEINELGYPDMGNGRYAALLSYEQWVEFNNCQRAHYNMVESSAPTLATVLAAGLYYPRLASGLGVAYAVGMYMFSAGYKSKKGADGRILGALLRSLSSLALVGICFYQAAIFARSKFM
jgi:glutathione S-transferase